MLSALVLSVLLVPAHAGAVCIGTEVSATAVGSGTSTDPWQICTVEQLRDVERRPDGHFLLVDDLDLAGIDWPGLTDCDTFPTVGGFEGHFDGGGQVISNLTSEVDGLFSCIHGGMVDNLILRNVDVQGDAYGTGSLVGHADEAVIVDVEVSGRVDSELFATGGLAGFATRSVFERVSFTGQIDGVNNVGGLLGLTIGSTLVDSYASGTVQGTRSLGGLVGTAYGTLDEVLIERCHAATTVEEDGTSTNPQAGSALGLVAGSVRFGTADGSGQDASVVFDNPELPTFGVVSTPDLDGVVLAVERAQMLDPETFHRAGWDLRDVWLPPTATSVPLLR